MKDGGRLRTTDGTERTMKMNWSQITQRLVMIGQLGLALMMPLLLCLAVCYLLCTRLGAPLWIYLPGFVFGLGSSFMTAYKFWLQVLAREKEDREKADRTVSFNGHK